MSPFSDIVNLGGTTTTILDRRLGHDAWTTRQLLLRCREISEEQLHRKFDIGDRNLLETFEHLIACMESHTDFMLGRTAYETYRDDESVEGMLSRLTIVAKISPSLRRG